MLLELMAKITDRFGDDADDVVFGVAVRNYGPERPPSRSGQENSKLTISQRGGGSVQGEQFRRFRAIPHCAGALLTAAESFAPWALGKCGGHGWRGSDAELKPTEVRIESGFSDMTPDQ